jgi:ATP-dependent helicase/nuclease subunit B
MVALSLRQVLAGGGAYAGVRFGTLRRLISGFSAGDETLSERSPLTAVALRAAARVALSVQPGLLAPMARHEATEASLAATYGDLRRLSSPELSRLASFSTRARDVVGLVRHMRTVLQSAYFDEAELLERATSRLAGGDIADIGIGGVVCYLPDRLRPEELVFIEVLARFVVVVVLAAVTGDELADGASEAVIGALAAGGFEIAEPVGVSGAGTGRFNDFVSAPDSDVEVRGCVRALLAFAASGGDLGRAVVSYPDGDRSADLGQRVVAQLRAAGIPCSGRSPLKLGDTPHGRVLAGLVALARPTAPGEELDRREVTAWIGSGPIRAGRGLTRDLVSVHAGEAGEAGEVPSGAWDRCSRAAGVLSGIEQWRKRLRHYAGQAPRRLVDGASAAAAEDLATFMERLHTLVAVAAAADSWATLSGWAEGALDELLEPGPEREALADAVAELSILDTIDPLSGLGSEERVARFAATLDVALGRPAGDRGRFGVGPSVGSLSEVAGLSADFSIVLGCREGDLPGQLPEDTLVTRGERERIDGLAISERADERGRRHLLWLLSASRQSTASFARIDVSAGRGVHPSRWLLGDLHSGETTDIPSFAGSLLEVSAGNAPAADLTDYELALLVGSGAAGQAPGRPAARAIAEVAPEFGRRLEAIAERARGGLNRFAGHVDRAVVPDDVWSSQMSATTLESLATCPFSFFAGKILRVTPLEAPERLPVIEPRERGTLMHEVLEGFFRPFVEGHRPIALLDARGRDELQSLAAAEFTRVDAAGKAGKAIFWDIERKQILRDLIRFVEIDLERSLAQGAVPIAAELNFGDESPLVIATGAREVNFRGRIDRVDRSAGGQLVVVDYKSGKSDGYKDIAKEPLGRGRHLQLPIYAKGALAAMGASAGVLAGGPAAAQESAPPGGRPGVPVRAEYRFVQATAGYDVVPVELTPELDEALSGVLGTLVSTIGSGCFPPRPGVPEFGASYKNCRYCDFDSVCTADRSELWERASADPRMKPYSDLAEGSGGSGANGAGAAGAAGAGGGETKGGGPGGSGTNGAER